MATVLRKLLLVCCGLAALSAPLVWGADWRAAATIVSALAIVWLLALRQKQLGLLGPHFFFDTIRLARKGRTVLLRIAYLLILLVTLWWSYESESAKRKSWLELVRQEQKILSIPPFRAGVPAWQPPIQFVANDQARVAERFVFTILLVQNLAILFLAPIYFGSALAEERERRTLELLQTTPLYAREIFFSKFWSRVLHLGGVVLASLPVLSVAQMFGGVDFEVVMANYVHSFFLLAAVGSLCLAISASASTATWAVLWSYAAIIALYFFCIGVTCAAPPPGSFVLSRSLLLARDEYMRIWWQVGGCAVVAGLVAFLSWLIGITSLAKWRMASDDTHTSPDAMEESAKASGDESGEATKRVLLAQRARWTEPPPVEDDAVYWKEKHFEQSSLFGVVFFCFALVSILSTSQILLFIAFGSAPPDRDAAAMRTLVQVQLNFVLAMLCLGVVLRSTAAIARERQQSCLDGLLTLPAERWEILWAKWKAGLWNGWVWAVAHCVTIVLACFAGFIHLCGLDLLVFAPLAHLLFLNSLGLYFSVHSKTVFAARMKLIVVVFVITIAYFVYNWAVPIRANDHVRMLFLGMNPVVAWNISLTPDAYIVSDPSLSLVALVFFHMLYYVFASLFWTLAMRRFEKLQ
ncbi:MAG: ABC transporter permease subunit [Gemmataceae bacterium]|nr:ABC transporter permease subunit [Gemmataceae bacterium]MCI0743746.1 ABC transporter permease subunit [Gemmataceae bacterium]